jgi:hypothetical protein
MAKPHWYRFEWDDENKKNGNVQHLRDHDIEPEEANNVSSMTTSMQETPNGSMTFISWMERLIAAEVYVGFSGQRWRTREGVHRLGTEENYKTKEMKKKFSKLTKSEQAREEANYHRMKPEELDAVISRAKSHSPDAIHLSPSIGKREFKIKLPFLD